MPRRRLPATREADMPDATDLFEIMQTTRAMRRLRPDPVPDALWELPASKARQIKG